MAIRYEYSIHARQDNLAIHRLYENPPKSHRPNVANIPAGSFPHIFPLKAIWFEAILACFGGGSMVATALIFVTLSDVTPTASM